MPAVAGLLALFIILAFSAGSAMAQAANPAGLYIGGSIGALIVDDNDGSEGPVDFTTEYDTSYSINGSLGYRFTGGLRTELELGYVPIGIDQASINGVRVPSSGLDQDLYTATVNLFFDIPLIILSPYIGAGVGAAYSKFDGQTLSAGGATVDFGRDSETSLMAFGEIGLNLYLTSLFAIAPSYRYIWIDNGGDGFDDTTAHLFRIGARLQF